MDETRDQVAEWLHAQLRGSQRLGAGTVKVRDQEVRAELLSVPESGILKVPALLLKAKKQYPHKTVRMVMWKGQVRLQVLDALEKPKTSPRPTTLPVRRQPVEPEAKPPQELHHRWSKPTQFGKLRVQSQHGTEAIVMPLKEGLWIVSEVPSKAVKEYGILPFIPGALRVASKIFRPQPQPQQQPQVVVVASPAQPTQLPAPAQPPVPRRHHARQKVAPAPAWMDEDDVDVSGMDLGCAACQGGCGRRT